MEFWGVKVETGQFVDVTPVEGKLLRVTQACLGEVNNDSKKGACLKMTIGSSQLVLATLHPERRPSQYLDVLIDKDCKILHTWPDGSVYFYGYHMQDPRVEEEPPIPIANEDEDEEEKKEADAHYCKFCPRTFKSQEGLSCHILAKHSKKEKRGGPLYCSVCDRTFSSEKAISVHKKEKKHYVKNLDDMEISPKEIVDVKVGVNKLANLRKVYLGETKIKTNKPVYVYVTVGEKNFVVANLLPESHTVGKLYLMLDQDFKISHSGKDGSVWFFCYEDDQMVPVTLKARKA